MSSLASFTVNNVEWQTVKTDDKPWPCAKAVCRSLEYVETTKTANTVKHHRSSKNIDQESETNPVSCPKDSHRYDYYSIEEGCMSFYFPVNNLQ